ncbi:hypothetical protein Gotri_023128 [Gossypium trilobum]|uniref:Uncharacterized protein n=1 Tax=Gossypium trilobum TaxID=34281 RepID=A0A7J9DI09_9ROSI|nr:hypothetical protein [Gossypium trilobum]
MGFQNVNLKTGEWGTWNLALLSTLADPMKMCEVKVCQCSNKLGLPKVGRTESLPKLGKLGVRKESFSKGVHRQQCTPNDMVWGSPVSLRVRFITVLASWGSLVCLASWGSPICVAN